MATNDEEWENAEVQLKSLEITAPVVMPSAAPPMISLAGVPPSIAIVERKEAIDDALMTALDNPRERLFVLQTEDLMLKYVKSSDNRHMDLPPGYNSFRRLLTYRLAKRFGLNHASSDHPIESERIIRLTKTSMTCIPYPLLIKYRRDIDGMEDIATGKGTESPLNDESSTPTADPPKKVMLMKRRTDGSNGGGTKAGAAKPQQSAEDREKAYKEARERIFGAEAAAVAESSNKDSVITPVGTSTRVSSASPSIPEANSVTLPLGKSTSDTAINERAVSSSSPALPSSNGSDKVKRSTSAFQLSTSPKKGTDANSNNATSGKDRRTVDTTTWREKKGQVKDVESERFDPDFNRSSCGRGRNNSRYYYSNPAEEFAQQEQQQQMQQSLPLAPSLGDYTPAVASYNPAWGYGGSAAYPSQPVQYDPYGNVMPPPPSLQTPPINNGGYYDAVNQWVASPGGQSGGYDPNYYAPQPHQYAHAGYYDPQQQQQQAYYGYSNPSPPQQYYQQQQQQQQQLQQQQFQQQQPQPSQPQQQQYSRGSSRGNDPRNTEQFPPLR